MNINEGMPKAARDRLSNEKEKDKMEREIADKQSVTKAEVLWDEMQLWQD